MQNYFRDQVLEPGSFRGAYESESSGLRAFPLLLVRRAIFSNPRPSERPSRPDWRNDTS